MIEPLEAQSGFQDLALRPLAAIHQEAVLIVLDQVRGEPAMNGWRGRRGPEEN
jgi:hypothetical protein